MCEIAKKGVKLLMRRNFQYKTYMQIIYILVTFKKADYGEKNLEKGVRKRLEIVK